MNKLETGEVLTKETETLKLMKMSKAYQWEIKLLVIDVDRIAEINQKMVNKFGEIGQSMPTNI